MLTSQVKQILIDVLVPMVSAHQAARAATSDEVVAKYMTPRDLLRK